jgi:hypothetical protein
MGASARGFIVGCILFTFLVLGIVVVGPGLSLPGGAVEMPKVMSGRLFFQVRPRLDGQRVVAFLHKPMLSRQVGIG